MIIPQLPNIVDLIRLQNTVALLLLADDRLATIPILTELRLHMENEVAVDALWTVPRGAIQVKPDRIDLFSDVIDTSVPGTQQGPVGAGLLVEMPLASTQPNGVTGPPLNWNIPIVAFEERNINLSPAGTFITCEQLAQLVLDILNLQPVYQFGTIEPTPNVIAPARDWEEQKPGIAASRCTMKVFNGRVQTPRSAIVAISFTVGMCTLACTDATVEVRYTIDGSPPLKSNPASIVYGGPFGVQSKQVVQAASWKGGQLTSSINGAVAP